MRVLVLGDDESQGSWIEQRLSDSGHLVDRASDGKHQNKRSSRPGYTHSTSTPGGCLAVVARELCS